MIGLPDRLRGNIVASASEGPLYELLLDADTRRRALEVYFDNQAEMAARIDAEAGHPFLTVLHVRRAAHEAGHLLAQWQAFDVALGQPALRQALERRHATMDTAALKRKLLVDALAKQPFLQGWITMHHPGTPEEGLVDLLAQIARLRARS